MKEKNINNLFERYMDECKYTRDLRPATLRGYKAAFDLLKALVPTLKLETLTETTMNYFFKTLETRTRTVGRGIKKTGVNRSTKRTYWNKLNTFFVWLQTKELIEKNPLSQVKVPYPTYDDSPALEVEEVDRLYAAVRNSKSILIRKRETLMISIMRYAGLRKGEYLGLQVKDIDTDKDMLTVQGETSKSRKNRELPIHPKLLQDMLDYLEERKKIGYTTPYLIVSGNKDKKLSAEGLKHVVERLVYHSGFKFHLHQLRHTFATDLAKAGVNIAKIQKALGHNDPRMTQRYLRSLKGKDLWDDILKL